MTLSVGLLSTNATNINPKNTLLLQMSLRSFLKTAPSELQVLINLGLTPTQARVYLALVEFGPLKVSAISKISKIARPDIYSTLVKLNKQGLVEKIIESPLKYRAKPIDESLAYLLEIRTRQYEKLRSETQILLCKTKMEKTNTNNQTEDHQFIFVPKGRPVIEKIKTAIKEAQLHIDLILSWKRFSNGIIDVFAESMEVAWSKKVRFRFIVESPPKNKTAKQLVHFCRKKPSCQIRFIHKYPQIILGVYDEKEAFIIANPEKDLPGSPALWSNNPSIIALSEAYFKDLWKKAIKNCINCP
ncbi:MAG: helix-turn-helix domain-containing protein [Candidatus Bathyarchaeia archaeon]